MKNINKEIGTLQLHQHGLFREASDIRHLFNMRTTINMYSVWINGDKYNLPERISDWDFHNGTFPRSHLAVMYWIKDAATRGSR